MVNKVLTSDITDKCDKHGVGCGGECGYTRSPVLEALDRPTDPADEREKFIKELKDTFEKALADKQIKLAAVIFTVDGEEEPQLYRKGHFYDTATLLNHVMNAYRARAAVELGL